MTAIVTYAHRYKPTRRKKKAQAAALTGPAIVTATSKRDQARRREMANEYWETGYGWAV